MSFSILVSTAKSLILDWRDIPKPPLHDLLQHICHILLHRNYLAHASNAVRRSAPDALKIRKCSIKVKQWKRTYMHLVPFIMRCGQAFLSLFSVLSGVLRRYSSILFLFKERPSFKLRDSSQVESAQIGWKVQKWMTIRGMLSRAVGNPFLMDVRQWSRSWRSWWSQLNVTNSVSLFYQIWTALHLSVLRGVHVSSIYLKCSEYYWIIWSLDKLKQAN